VNKFNKERTINQIKKAVSVKIRKKRKNCKQRLKKRRTRDKREYWNS
jgi:hypothetical protein